MRLPPFFRALVSSRLVQFAVLGAPLFALAPRPPSPERVRLSAGAVEALRQSEAARRGVPEPSQSGALARFLADEILYREALRLGLDRGDPVVRQRLIQKLLLRAEDEAGATRPPTGPELRAFFEATRERWRSPAALRFIQVFATADRREALAALRPRAEEEERKAPGVAPALGQPLGLPRDVPLTPAARLAEQYGADFVKALEALPPGAWSAPLPSRYGWHLVKVLERREGGPASFEEVRGQLPFQLLLARKQRALDALLRAALPRYRIEVEGRPHLALEFERAAPHLPPETP